MDLRIVTVAERPDLKSSFGNAESEPWPAFMDEDPMALLYYSDVRTAHPEYAFVAYDAEAPDQAVARAFCVPFAWDGDPARGELPEDGWDGVIWRSARDRQLGRPRNLVSALEITIATHLQGTGLSGRMLAAMRENAARLGFDQLVAPVRPNRKHLVPDLPIDAYAALVREDGLPQDPWLRVHVRAGGRIVGTCKRAMVIPGTLAEWRSWTGLPFDTSGPVVVPGALVPVQCSVEQDIAVYVEPGVWVHHPL
ncbi:N-acetyltransferase [Streptomyces sp. 3MP-14]|uniref:N-acetyltransferase n=1 Tax=Streptomyces mimosae TaxID=2586635 RepID=A0A5N5ZSJ6_9ACTN|nr:MULTISPECIES: N-acetyltransferase [Streptomyces]KAB8159477.1 N-acetyltransferase [Streptomyces mimosae]KAB8172635.1 N-acetyltransferase [Streptomyces sp. 3MP-14]